MNFSRGRILGCSTVAILALAFTLAATSAKAECRLDWNDNGFIDQDDYLIGDPMGGFYAEWYIYTYYPSYYPILFPGADSARLDYNGDTMIDEADLMGGLNPALPTEGYYVEWYIFSFYPGYYPIFMPEYDCENPPPVDTDGDGVPDHLDPCPNDYPDDLDNDGACGIAPKLSAEDCSTPFLLNHYTIHNEDDVGPLNVFGNPANDFVDDWLDDHDFTSTPGCGDPAPPDTDTVYSWNYDFVLQANVKAGQTLSFWASMGTFVNVRVLDVCDETAGTCLDSWIGETHADPTNTFTPSIDTTYYIVVEADANAYAYQSGYSFEAMVYDTSETYCGDGLDNDMDGLFDCVDPDCYGSCGVDTLFYEPFDAASGWNVTTYGAWGWLDAANPTGGTGGYLNLNDPIGADETFWVEMDIASVDMTQYSTLYFLMSHSDPQFAYSREPRLQVSYNDGASWNDVFSEYDFNADYNNLKYTEVFNISAQLEGRSSPRLRIAAHRDCATYYNPTDCAGHADEIDWSLDDIILLGWGSPSSDTVVDQIDTSVDFFTTSNQPVIVDPPVVQGSGETCDDAVILTRTILDLDSGEDFANREVEAQCGNGPNVDGYDADHDYNAIASCQIFYSWWSPDDPYPVDGKDKVYTVAMEAGERVWALSKSGIDAQFFLLEGGCDPLLTSPECSELWVSEQHGLWEFVAPLAGTYSLVFKTRPFDPCDQPWNSNRTVDWELEVGHYTGSEINCGNGIDDDGDGQVDCNDPNCVGMCARNVIYSEYFTGGIPSNFEVTGKETDRWNWCDAVDCGGIVNSFGPDYNRFSDSGGGYAILVDKEYGGAPSMATPTIDISGHGGTNLGLTVSLRYTSINIDFDQTRLYIEVLVDGQVVIGRGEANEVSYQGWVRGAQFIDLSAFATTAQTVKVRFSVATQSGLKSYPWRLDDLILVSW